MSPHGEKALVTRGSTLFNTYARRCPQESDSFH